MGWMIAIVKKEGKTNVSKKNIENLYKKGDKRSQYLYKNVVEMPLWPIAASDLREFMTELISSGLIPKITDKFVFPVYLKFNWES